MADPIKESLIQDRGPPRDTKSATSVLKITKDGPIDVMTLLFMASFICPRVSPVSSPVW
jgi:hypothetical protein